MLIRGLVGPRLHALVSIQNYLSQMMSDSEEESENEEKEDEAASAVREDSPPPPQVRAKSSRPFDAIPAPSSLVVTKPHRMGHKSQC